LKSADRNEAQISGYNLAIFSIRTIAISRASLLTGHVLGTVIQTMLGLALSTGVALLIGFRPEAGFAAYNCDRAH
jgi:hypothetical protein